METPDRHSGEPLSTAPDGARRYAVTSNEPVEVIDPVRKFRMIAIVCAVVVVIVSAASSYAAVTIANQQSEQRIDQAAQQVMAVINGRTAERRASEGVVTRILEQNRRTHCSEMRAIREIDEAAGAGPEVLGEIDKLYAVYHCGTAKDPIVPPGWVPPEGWPPLPGSEPLPRPVAPATPSPSPAPAPATTQ